MAWEYFQRICCSSLFSTPDSMDLLDLRIDIFVVIMLVIEWLQRRKVHGFDIANLKPLTRYVLVVLLIEFVLFFMATTPSQFIYFQF